MRKTRKSTSIEASGLCCKSPAYATHFGVKQFPPGHAGCSPHVGSDFMSSWKKNASPEHLQVKTSEGRSCSGHLGFVFSQ